MERRVSTTSENVIEELEAILVKIFRLFQSLLSLVKDERQFLVENDAEAVEDISGKKQEILFTLELMEQERQSKAKELGQIFGIEDNIGLFGELLKKISHAGVERLRHLQQGILSLQKEIREINSGNYALANLNLQKIQAVQSYLLNTLQPPSSFYGPDSKRIDHSEPSAWQMDQNV